MYILLLIFFYFISVLYNVFIVHKTKNKFINRVFISVVMGMASVIVGLRSTEVGVDTPTYETLFYEFSSMSWSEIFSSYFHIAIEIGYVVLMKLTSIVLPNYYFFQFTIALLTFYMLARFLEHFSIDPRITVLLFLSTGLFFASFNVQRQVFTVAVVSYSFLHIVQGRKVSGIIYFLLSITFHISAIISGIIFLIWGLRYKKRLMKILPFVILALPLLGEVLLNIFFVVTLEKYNTYMDNTREIQVAGLIKLVWLFESIVMFTVIFKANNPSVRCIAVVATLYIAFYIMGLSINYAQRIGMYFMPFMYLSVDRFLHLFSSRNVRYLIAGGLFMVFGLLYCLSSFGTKLEYQFFLDKL